MDGMGTGMGMGSGRKDTFDQDPFMSNHSSMSEMGMGMGGFPNMNTGFGSRTGKATGGVTDPMMEGMSFDSSPSNSFFGSPRSFSAAMPPPHGRRQQQSQATQFPSTSSFSQSSSIGGGTATYSSTSTSSSTSTYGFGSNSSSESRQTRTINGRMETVVTKVDAQGDETVQIITPDAKSVFVNGVEQNQHPLLGNPSSQSQQQRVGHSGR